MSTLMDTLAPPRSDPGQALLAERARLLGEARALELSTRASADTRHGGDGDPADSAADLMEQELIGTLSHLARTRLADIDDALARVHAHTYGGCEDCGQPIEADRLDALPWARRCLACQRWSERRRR